MEPTPPSATTPPLLAPGTLLGPWRVVALAGRGVNGEVYRAVRAEDEQAPPVALKLALRPWDTRFTREVKLLSQVRHPSIPQFVDQGVWRPEDGAPHPFFVMEWVDGEPLYDWAQRQPPTDEQVLRLLGQLAQALEALHAVGGVHRDVKGANILVRREDGRAILTDFGSGVPLGASTLTPPGAFVGTPAYRSAESWLFELRSLRQPDARYTAGPADDVFALGTTACRLLTGQYPEPGEPSQDSSGTWNLESMVIPPALHAVEEPLRGLVLSMLAVHPEQRPTAARLALSLEQAGGVKQAAPEPSRERVRPVRHWARAAAGVALSGASLLLAAGVGWRLIQQPARMTAAALNEAVQEDGNTGGLGETASSLSEENPAAPAGQQAMADEPLPEPQPGQLRTDVLGRCSRKKLVPLNGACWVRTLVEREDCEVLKGQMFKGMCYQPIIPPSHPPTSGPQKK